MDEELAFAKARMTISKEEEEKVDEDEGIETDKDEEEIEIEKLEKLECMTRQIYDTKGRRFDYRKRRGEKRSEWKSVQRVQERSMQ